MPKYKTAVTHKERLDDVSEVVEMITSDVIESKEISHMWDEGMGIINARLATIEERLTLLESKILKDGLTDLERKIERIIREQMTDFTKELSTNYMVPSK